MPSGAVATRQIDRDHEQLDHRHAQRVPGRRPGAEGDDVQRVEHAGHEGQRLAVPDREAVQGQHAQPDRRQRHRAPGDRRDPRPEQDGREQGRAHDVHPGDEAGHAGRGVRQPGGLQDLRDAVDASDEHARGAARSRGSARTARCATANITSPAMANRTARKSSVGTRSSRSLIRKNVLPQLAVVRSSAPGRQQRAASGGHPPSHEVEGDRRADGQLGAGAGVLGVDVAEADVAGGLLDARPRTRRPGGSRWRRRRRTRRRWGPRRARGPGRRAA